MVIKRKLFSKEAERKKSDKEWDAALGAGIGTAAGIAGKTKLEKMKSIKKLKNATNARINKVHDYRTEKVETEMQKRINTTVDPFEKSVLDEVKRGKHKIINDSRKNVIETVGKKRRRLKIAEASFIKGAEWVLKEMSDHIRNNMSYSNKAWDILPFIEMIKGNSEPYIDYLRNKKAEAIQDIDMNVIQQNISDIKE